MSAAHPVFASAEAEYGYRSAVYYPGLKSHPFHEIAKKQMIGGFGGMVSFTFTSGAKADAISFLEKSALPAR